MSTEEPAVTERVTAQKGALPVPNSLLSAARRAGFWFFCSWPLGTAALYPWSKPAALWYFAATHVLALYSALRANSQIFGDVVQTFTTDRCEVWLTIDDGPFEGDTEAMIEVLARHGATATFFLEGARVLERPDLARRIVEAGHSIGNHSHTHPVSRFWALGPWSSRRELSRCSEAVLQATGRSPLGFRPPVGMANGFVHRTARRLGLPLIGWSARGYDGLDSSPDRVTRRVLSQLTPGAILLLHQRPGLTPSEACNATTLDHVLCELTKRGYRCVLPEAHRFRTE